MEKSFRELIVWQQSLDLVELVYRTTEDLPKSEDYGLKSQMRRAAVSIPSNIAEGSGRGTTKDYKGFLRVAKGSARELETLIEISIRVGHLDHARTLELTAGLTSVSKLLNRLIASLGDGRADNDRASS